MVGRWASRCTLSTNPTTAVATAAATPLRPAGVSIAAEVTHLIVGFVKHRDEQIDQHNVGGDLEGRAG